MREIVTHPVFPLALELTIFFDGVVVGSLGSRSGKGDKSNGGVDEYHVCLFVGWLVFDCFFVIVDRLDL